MPNIMIILKNTWAYICDRMKAFRVLLQLLVLITSTTHLHYLEIIENEGLLLCKMTESQGKSCTPSQKEDNDKDDETVQVIVDFNFLKTNSLKLNIDYFQLSHLPQYKNSYHFAFLPKMIKPPILS